MKLKGSKLLTDIYMCVCVCVCVCVYIYIYIYIWNIECKLMQQTDVKYK